MKIKQLPSKPKRKKVNFYIEAANATEVALTGTFNNWNPAKHPMKKDRNGIWNKTLMLPVGQYEYKFLIDGEWKQDPLNDQTYLNSFGTLNNVINLLTR